MRLLVKICFFGLATFMIFSCNVSKKLPIGEKIYTGANIEIIKSDSVKSENLDILKAELETFTRPLPNTVFPLTKKPYKVAMFYALGQPKNNKGFKGWLNKILGEEPVFFNTILLQKNVENLGEIVKNKGYFNGKVNAKMQSSNSYNHAEYYVDLKKRFYIDSVSVESDSSKFGADFNKIALKNKLVGFFDLDKLKAEQVRIDLELRAIGYYNFKPSFVAFYADTTQKPKNVILKVGLNNNMVSTDKKQFQINDIYINVDSKTEIVRTEGESDLFRGFIFEDSKGKFKEKLFTDAIAFRPGTFFNSSLNDISNTRLISLNNFNFVKSSFDVVNRLDSSLIDIHYFLKSQKAKVLKFEANGITSSSGLGGSQFSLGWQNLNTFKRGELFKISLSTKFEFQLGIDNSSLYRKAHRDGLEMLFMIPRFFAPFIKIDPEYSKILPSTTFKLSYEKFIKNGLYNLSSVKGSIGYSWTKGKGITHTFRPLAFNSVRSSDLSNDFVTEIFNDPRLLVILNDQLIVGSGYEIVVNKKNQGKHNFYYQGNFDLAGNMFALVDRIRNNSDKSGKMFGEYYSQFVRIENDIRYRNEVSQKLTWANRAILGLGIPIGNSLTMPFTSQFYVGGNNSLRAFVARGVGPGAYTHTNSVAEQFIGTNTGDIKIEFNTELRYKLNNFFIPAIFVDAGNVWMYKDGYFYGDESIISKDFYKQFGLGAGIGLRFDLTFVIFRIDVATPLRNPGFINSNPWVIKDFGNNKGSRIVTNIAIGLPF